MMKYRIGDRVVVKNLKSLGNRESFPLRPITVVFGPNSAGKSSVLHALLFLDHYLGTGEVEFASPVSGDNVDFGGFLRLLHRHDRKRRMVLGFSAAEGYFKEAEWAVPDCFHGHTLNFEFSFGYAAEVAQAASLPKLAVVGQGIRWALDHAEQEKAKLGEPRLVQLRVSLGSSVLLDLVENANGDLVAVKIDWSDQNLVAFVEHAKRMQGTTSTGSSSGTKRALREIQEHLLVGSSPSDNWPAVLHISQIPDVFALFRKGGGSRKGFYFGKNTNLLKLDYRLAERLRHNANNAAERAWADAVFVWSGLLELLRFSVGLFRVQFSEVHHVGPVRSIPARSAWVDYSSPNASRSESAWKALVTDDGARAWVSKWLAAKHMDKRYALRLYDHFRVVSSGTSSKTGSNSVRGNGSIEPENLEKIGAQVRLVDLDTGLDVESSEVGSGVSFVMPILVALAGHKDSVLLLEQPELHLHPRMQTELADVMVESALGKLHNCVVVETHSEHILLRLMKRIRQTNNGTLPRGKKRLSKDDVGIVYVRPVKNGGAELLELELDDTGRLVNGWPDGFFDEGFNERFDDSF